MLSITVSGVGSGVSLGVCRDGSQLQAGHSIRFCTSGLLFPFCRVFKRSHHYSSAEGWEKNSDVCSSCPKTLTCPFRPFGGRRRGNGRGHSAERIVARAVPSPGARSCPVPYRCSRPRAFRCSINERSLFFSRWCRVRFPPGGGMGFSGP